MTPPGRWAADETDALETAQPLRPRGDETGAAVPGGDASPIPRIRVIPETSSSFGRPRDRALDDRIPEELLALLGCRGHAGLTLDEPAARSGVVRTTILRRRPSKAAVAAEGWSGWIGRAPTRRILLALLHGAVETLVRGRGQFVARPIREAGPHPEITDHCRPGGETTHLEHEYPATGPAHGHRCATTEK